MSPRYDQYRRFRNAFMSGLFVLCAVLVVSPLALILFHLLREGIGALNWSFFTQLPNRWAKPAAAWRMPSWAP